jgi:hypothetical protein
MGFAGRFARLLVASVSIVILLILDRD